MLRTENQLLEISEKIRNSNPITFKSFECREVPREFMFTMKGRSMNAIEFERLKRLMPEYVFSMIKGLGYYAIKKA